MMKYIFQVILVCIFLLGSFHAHAQYNHQYQRKPAQLTPTWIKKAQKGLSERSNYVKSSRTGSKTIALKPIGSNASPNEIENSTLFPAYKEDEVFIKFKAHLADKVQEYSRSSEANNAISHRGLSTMLSQAKVSRLRKLSENKNFKSISTTYKAVLEKGISVDKAIETLQKSPEVEYVERVPLYRTLQTPNDALYVNGRQYALDLIHAIEAFDLQTNNHEVFVAIVDDAFLYDHPDLAANVAVDKCYDVADNDSDPRPPAARNNDFTHGTHVGGIIGAVTNNGLGIASVSNNQIKIFGIKATRDNTDEPRNIDNSYEGVLKAIENGADVINMSFGGTANSQTWQNMINDATAAGVVFVAAAGNGNTSALNYPAAYDNVIAVSNTDQNDVKNPSSHYGNWVDIAAPGTNILSTVANDGSSGAYASSSGTSMASPMVAGLVGLMLTQNNTLSHDQVLAVLQSTADNIDAKNPGLEGKLGAGRINAYNAMLAASGSNPGPIADFVSSDQDVFVGQTVSFSSQSLGTGLTYSWSFEGGSPASATGKNASVSYNNTGSFNVRLIVTNAAGTDVVTRTDYVNVISPQDCAMLSYPLEGTRTLYYYVNNDTDENNGPAIGQNINGFTRFANLYDYLPGNYISGGLFAIGLLKSGDPENAIVRFKVWEESSLGTFPGSEIASQEIAYSDLKITRENQSKTNRASYSEIFFDKPPAVPANGRFYLGFEVYYESGDTIGFYTNEEGEGNGNESFTFYDGHWASFTEIDFSANIEMSPVLVGGNYLNVNAFVAEGGACVGNTVTFNTDGILQDITAYEWRFEGGNPASSTAANPVVQYTQQGEFEAELILTLEGCEEARKKFVKEVKIIDCDLKPQADFSANRYVIEAGDSIHFFERADHATGFLWTFEGGEPATSALFDPFVRYSEPGVYKVALEVSNPVGEISSLVKEEYIEVFEAGYCNFYIDSKRSNVPANSTPTLYYSEGFITGTGFGDLAKVEFFDISNNETLVNQLDITFGEASTNDGNATVEVVVYDASGLDDEENPGAPGVLLATKVVRIADIAEDVAAGLSTAVVFDEPVQVQGPFYAGIHVNMKNDTDSVAILSTTSNEVEEGTSWELDSERFWRPTSRQWEAGGSGDPLNIALYITAHISRKSQEREDECNPLNVENTNQPTVLNVYPNPFTSTTTIAYELKASGAVKLEVFNSLGKKVAILEDSFKPKGVHQSVFDASYLPKGLYIYKLQTEDEHAVSGRMILQ